MKTLKKICVGLVVFALCSSVSYAQRRTMEERHRIETNSRIHVGINLFDVLSLGTINVEGGVAVGRRWSIHAGAELNPWTWRGGDAETPLADKQQTQLQARQMSFWAGARWWPWHVYSGWWVGADGRYSIYNQGGIFSRATEEGKAYGGGIYGGYSIMLNEWLNLDLGVGAFGGWKQYTSYACPVCGVITDQGAKVFIVPDARVALQFIF